ncbi:MAG TPA: DUF4136 domain-containing protein [Candidatus Acidoferrales bacterium]|nr:DUF4136 domain-containing protein [Candidatus Acidoferrales bacterium]HXK01232.1 DUF4136 domain-containing protein [Verrucomicrobiae bacterium]
MRSIRMILPVAILAVSGFAQDVRYNFAQGTDFSKYKTYKWVKIGDASNQLNDMMDSQVKASIDAVLAGKGLTKTESDNADLDIGYQFALTQEKQFTSMSSDFGYGAGWGGGWYRGGGMGMSTTTGTTSTIQIGNLALDMYDMGQKKLVWRGMASKTLDAKAKPDKQKKNLDKAMAKLLKNYPPPVKK